MPRPRTALGFLGRGRCAAAVVLALGLLGAARSTPLGRPPILDGEPPATGRFLIATERIRGAIFHESVVYLISYNESGALGVIVNRPTDVRLHEVVKGARDGAGTLYLGGPVEPSQVMMLVRSDSPPDRAVHVADDVFMTVDPAILLERTGKEGGSGQLRVYAGYAGWSHGQLEREISRGDWIVASVPSASIFDEAPAELWKKLFRRHHRLITSVPWVVAIALLVLGCSVTRGAELYREGTRALDRGDAESAVAALERAAEQVPRASEVQNHLGLAYLASGRPDDALRAFERAVMLDCDNQAAQRNLQSVRARRLVP